MRPLTIAEALVAATSVAALAVPDTYGVILYALIGLPPLLAGSLQLSCAWPVATATDWIVGADASPAGDGVTSLEALDAVPAP